MIVSRRRKSGTATSLLLLLAGGCAAPSPAPAEPVETERGWRGHLVWGHESRSFTPCGSNRSFWVADETEGELRRAYESLTTEPYQRLFVELSGEAGPAPTEGFGADYDGGLVARVLHRAVNEGPGCTEDVERFEMRASGNEPFWNVIVAESGVVFSRMGDTGSFEFPYNPPEVAGERRIYETRTGLPPRALRVELEPGRCTDSMTGAWSDYHATVSLDDRELTGCAYRGGRRFDGAVRYEVRTIDETMAGCGPEGTDACTWFRFDYPKLESGLPSAAMKTVQARIDAFVRAPLADDQPEADPTELVSRWNERYAAFRKAFPEASQTWTVRRTASLLAGPGPIVNVELREEADTGGAHPNRRRQYVAFDTRDGRRLDLSGVLVAGGVEQLTGLAERRFRELRGIGPDADLEKAGFWFEDGRFVLPDRFSLTPSRILFHYDAYEIAPYSLGPTTLEVKRNEFEAMLRPEFRAPSNP